jgi:hypothetical protein
LKIQNKTKLIPVATLMIAVGLLMATNMDGEKERIELNPPMSDENQNNVKFMTTGDDEFDLYRSIIMLREPAGCTPERNSYPKSGQKVKIQPEEIEWNSECRLTVPHENLFAYDHPAEVDTRGNDSGHKHRLPEETASADLDDPQALIHFFQTCASKSQIHY